jgi:hypothetical protein
MPQFASLTQNKKENAHNPIYPKIKIKLNHTTPAPLPFQKKNILVVWHLLIGWA